MKLKLKNKASRKILPYTRRKTMKKLILGLLILLSASMMFGQTLTLDADSGFYIYMKGSQTKLSEEEYLTYAQGFEKEIYNKYHNDEFEWFDQFQIIKEKCDKKIEEADLTATYTVVTTVEFGDYDFTNGGFPISIEEGTFFPLGITSSYYNCDYYSIFNNKIALSLDKFHEYNFLVFEKDAARTFLQGRKDRYGNIDRTITLQITYKIAAFDSAEYKEFEDLALSNNYLPIVGIIESIEVYDTKDQRNIKKIGTLIKK